MISLHRLGHQAEEFFLNPDLIITVEGNPDTVITLTTGTKIVVAEAPDRVVQAIREFRVEILSGSLATRRQDSSPQPHGTYARRAHQGMLRAVDRDADDTESESSPGSGPHESSD